VLGSPWVIHLPTDEYREWCDGRYVLRVRHLAHDYGETIDPAPGVTGDGKVNGGWEVPSLEGGEREKVYGLCADHEDAPVCEENLDGSVEL
jgi:hypothetical protein